MKMIQKRGPQPPEETDLWACVSRLKDQSGGVGAMCRNSAELLKMVCFGGPDRMPGTQAVTVLCWAAIAFC